MSRHPVLPHQVHVRFVNLWTVRLRNVGAHDSFHESMAFLADLAQALKRSPWAACCVVRRHLVWARLTVAQREQADRELDRWWRRHRYERETP